MFLKEKSHRISYHPRVSYGTKTKAKHQLFEHELQSATAESAIFDYDSGKDCGEDSLALIPAKSPNPLDASTERYL